MRIPRDQGDEIPSRAQAVENGKENEPAISTDTPGRAARPANEGPGAEGGSGLDSDDAAAVERVGGGD